MEQEAKQLANRLHAGNSKHMLPATLSGVALILIYLVMILDGLRTPPGQAAWLGVAWGVIAYILITFLLLGGLNTLLFELWVGRTLEKAVQVVVAAPGTQPQLTSAEATQSLVILLEFPFRFCLRFVIHWLIVAPILIFLQRLFYGYPWTTLLNLALGTFLILSLMSLFHYFVIKSVYAPYLTRALKNFPAFIHQPQLARRRVSYQGKVFLYVLVLVGTMTWIASQIAIENQEEAAHLDQGRFFQHQVELVRETLQRELAAPSVSGALAGLVERLRFDPEDSIYLLDRQGRNLLGAAPPALHQRILNQLPEIESGPAKEDSRWYRPRLDRVLLLRLGPNVVRALAEGKDFSLSLAPLEPNQVLLVDLSPETAVVNKLMSKILAILGIFGAGLFLAGLFAWFMSRELLSPLHGVIASMGQVAEGNLRDREPILSDDETGELAVHHYRMVDSLRQMIERIGRASSSIEAASARIGERPLEMAEGSSAQAASVEETSAGMTEMNSTIKAIAESVETLAGTAQESSASILEMSATIEQVAQNAEQLFHAVEEVSSSLTEMTASIREVATNVRDASERAAEAAGSGREIREAIRVAEAETNRTAALSEQVTADAEQGAAAVQSTISGIERIRAASNEAAAVITGLSRRARDIGNILTVIEDVTEETGLLALNAAIIAAQAGEHGRGFAVVADEIKDLAERTQASAAEIAEQIRAVQSEAQKASAAVLQGAESVEAGVRLSEQAGLALKKILESAEQSLAMAREIAASMARQGQKSDQMMTFFENVSALIQQVATATAEQNSGGDRIMRAAERMREIATQVQKATKEQAIGSHQITQAIENVSQITTYINSSQTEQLKSSDQVLSAMHRISLVAEQNAEAVNKVSQAVENLSVLANELRAMVGKFQLEERERKTKEF